MELPRGEVRSGPASLNKVSEMVVISTSPSPGLKVWCPSGDPAKDDVSDIAGGTECDASKIQRCKLSLGDV